MEAMLPSQCRSHLPVDWGHARSAKRVKNVIHTRPRIQVNRAHHAGQSYGSERGGGGGQSRAAKQVNVGQFRLLLPREEKNEGSGRRGRRKEEIEKREE